MLNQRINTLINQIKIIKDNSSFLENQNRQKQVDNKYKIVVQEFNYLINQYIMMVHVIDFKLCDESVDQIREITLILNEVIKDGQAQEKLVNSASNKLVNLKIKVKNEWIYYYQKLTTGIISSLNIFKNVKPEEVNRYLDDLNTAQTWESANEIHVSKLKHSIDEAKVFIEKNSDNNINEFLNKIHSGRAKLSDITPEVYKWIREENLEDKILIKFK